ncbi:uncharacterized protein LOC119307123 isoform X1 [Triticum dicoccoides]|uniref:uncharacterized protein LOC119307123 isoform X1 n=1 Tax=Triticum dicoccoides TaxID=85692 RepID=UPI00188E98FB|nr:uncharacterized protein LOC119307123 isoform X1 [Triticum dicoccoides]
MAPMKVYGWAVSPWMARVLVCLEEAGAEYELVSMSRNGGDHRRPEHLARNSFSEIPVLEDGDLMLYLLHISLSHAIETKRQSGNCTDAARDPRRQRPSPASLSTAIGFLARAGQMKRKETKKEYRVAQEAAPRVDAAQWEEVELPLATSSLISSAKFWVRPEQEPSFCRTEKRSLILCVCCVTFLGY